MATDKPSRRLILSSAAALTMGAETRRSNDPATWTLESAAAALARRKISSLELTTACLKRIARHDAAVNAFITRREEQAIAAAKRSDRERDADKLLALCTASLSL